MMSSKPARMWIDGRSYDIKALTEIQKKNKKPHVEAVAVDLASANTRNDYSRDTTPTKVEEVIDNKKLCFSVTAMEDGTFFTCFRIPSYYYIKLNQLYLSTLKDLSENTNTKIIFPTDGKDGEVSITGEDERTVCEARCELHSAIGEVRNGLSAMQFISMPLLSDEVKQNFEKFKAEILSWEDNTGIEDSIFQKSSKLHLTIVVFALLDDSEKSTAAKALEEYKEEILSDIIKKEGPLKIRVCEIDCMNENHKKVDVLYANVKLLNEDDNHSLQTIVNGISDYFYEKGFVIRYQNNVKLHMTLMNTKYRKQTGSPRRWVKRQSFDAKKIMEHFKDYYFGICNLETIHLSLMSSEGEDGFYKSLSTIRIA